MQPMRDDAFNYENTNSESSLFCWTTTTNRPSQAKPGQARPGQAKPGRLSTPWIARSTSRNRGNFIYLLYTSVFVLTISLPSPASLPPFVRRPRPLLRHNEQHSVGNETLWTLSKGGEIRLRNIRGYWEDSRLHQYLWVRMKLEKYSVNNCEGNNINDSIIWDNEYI